MNRNVDDLIFEMCSDFDSVRADELEIRKRLAALEAADPSQQRPKKVPCIWDRVAFMEWETEEDLEIIDWPWPKEMTE
jgi:hypothetical protein